MLSHSEALAFFSWCPPDQSSELIESVTNGNTGTLPVALKTQGALLPNILPWRDYKKEPGTTMVWWPGLCLWDHASFVVRLKVFVIKVKRLCHIGRLVSNEDDAREIGILYLVQRTVLDPFSHDLQSLMCFTFNPSLQSKDILSPYVQRSVPQRCLNPECPKGIRLALWPGKVLRLPGGLAPAHLWSQRSLAPPVLNCPLKWPGGTDYLSGN